MDKIFALDIGTRSIIGMVGTVEGEKVNILAIDKEEHSQRAMVDGQIENIEQVAKVAAAVKGNLEEKLGCQLTKVHVAAAGRALRTEKASFELELSESQIIDEEIVRNLEAGAIGAAESAFEKEEGSRDDRQYYLAGYSVSQYYLDHYPISSLDNHRGKKLAVDVIATFLPREVVESLYTAMNRAGLEVASLTLEPIASMNASIPQNLRLLNLALVDIGAGTSDIAVARDGSICGYTMATTAGDEITEELMRKYLVDFPTAEAMKFQSEKDVPLSYTDVLGFEHSIMPDEILESMESVTQSLGSQIAEKVLEVNEKAPSAVFLVGGGSKLTKIREYVAHCLDMDLNRVALGGNNFSINAFSDEYALKDPEYSTPLGILISAALNLINDSFDIMLNGERAKLFRNGKLTVLDILMMNGYGYKDMMGRSGQNLAVYIDGKRKNIHGEYALPAQIRINGTTGSLSDMVHAGDEIEFESAISGKDGFGRLEDVAEIQTYGSVRLEEEEIPIGKFATVNDEIVSGQAELHIGDQIKTYQVYSVKELMDFTGIHEAVEINGDVVPLKTPLKDKDIVRLVSLSEDMKIIYEKFEEEPPLTKEPVRLELPISIKLNGEPLVLSKKPDGMPYYVMDMLTKLDLDFKKPDGVIVLKKNGEDAGFQTELTNNDTIHIYWSGSAV